MWVTGSSDSSALYWRTSIQRYDRFWALLNASASVDRRSTISGREISVQVQNSGGADESNIEVGATFTPEGGAAVSTKKSVQTITQGETSTVQLELPATVKAGQSGQLVIKVGGVPGEEKLDNNEATYSVTIGG